MNKDSFAQKFLMAGLGLMLTGGCAHSQRTPGKVAPNFELTDLSGQKVSLAQHKGHVVMVCFWAVGWPPCRAESPHLKTLAEKYEKDGFRLLAVNAWDEPEAKVKEYVSKEKLGYTVLLNGRSVLREGYSGKSIPHNFLIDKEGRIAFDEVGFSESGMKDIEKRIQELLKE